MRQYTTIHPLYKSFFSKSFYKDVGTNWKRISFIYLLLLLAITWIPGMFNMQSKMNDFIINEAPKIIGQIPAIEISNGIVTTDVAMPYYIKDPDTGEVVIAIDTTGKINSLEEAKAKMLITKSKLLIQKSAVETRLFDLSNIEGFIINQSKVYSWADTFRSWLIIIMYPFIVVFAYIYRVIQSLIYALIGKLFAKALKVDLNYSSLVSLSIISLTPAIILNSVYAYVELKIPFWWLICFIITMGYLYFGIRANKKSEVPVEKSGQ